MYMVQPVILEEQAIKIRSSFLRRVNTMSSETKVLLSLRPLLFNGRADHLGQEMVHSGNKVIMECKI